MKDARVYAILLGYYLCVKWICLCCLRLVLYLKKNCHSVFMTMEITQTLLPIILVITFNVQPATTSCPNCLHGLCISESDVHCLYGCKTGYSGGRCFNLCTNKGCPPDTDCYRDPVVLNRNTRYDCSLCPDGYYRGSTSETFNCSSKCPKNCKTCSSDLECHECKALYYNQGEFRYCSTRCPEKCAACLSPTWCTECIPPYANYGETMDCSWSCPENCEQCNDTKCSSCVTGHYDLSSHCNETCPVNCLSCSSEDKCNQCKAGFYNGHEMDDPKFQYSESCNWSCRSNCSECTEYNSCQKCITGTYGSVCEKQCSIGCKFNTCDKNTGACPCENSFSGDKCCVRSPYCKTCSSVTDCAECVAGHYGESCQYKCNNTCLNDCVKSSGNCNACIHNTYGNFCENNCSAGCLDNMNDTTICNRSTGLCLHGCKVGFYGEKCETLCSAMCKDGCDAVFGICNDCVLNTYGLYCENRCSLGCSNESSSVSTCNSSTGECLSSCKTGFFSYSCDKKCAQTCKRGCDRATGYCDSCAENDYGSYCNGTCPEYCFSEDKNETKCNESNGICLFGCKEGYYGENCTEKCSEKCTGDVCNASTGHCLHGCRAGFYGGKCEQLCSSRCKDWCDAILGICNDCVSNTYGLYCENSCPEGCLFESSSVSACNSSTGECLSGCKTGFFSDVCDRKCAQTCKSGCDRATGYCDSCTKNKYGSYCNGTCPENCFSIDKNETKCQESNGICLYGCKEGYYGEHCTFQCSENCTGNVCNASTGVCLYGLQRGDLSSKDQKLYTEDELEKKLATAVVVTCILTVMINAAVLYTVRFVRNRLAAKGVYRKENMHMTEQTVVTYETLEARQENQLTDYDTVQITSSDYANTVA